MAARPYRIGAHFTQEDWRRIAELGVVCGAGLSEALRGLARCALDHCTEEQRRAAVRAQRRAR